MPSANREYLVKLSLPINKVQQNPKSLVQFPIYFFYCQQLPKVSDLRTKKCLREEHYISTIFFMHVLYTVEKTIRDGPVDLMGGRAVKQFVKKMLDDNCVSQKKNCRPQSYKENVWKTKRKC